MKLNRDLLFNALACFSMIVSMYVTAVSDDEVPVYHIIHSPLHKVLLKYNV